MLSLAGTAHLAQAQSYAILDMRHDSSATAYATSPQVMQRRVTLSVKDARVSQVLDQIVEQSGISLSYQDQMLASLSPVTISFTNTTVQDALAQLLTPYKLRVDRTAAGHYIVARNTTQDTGIIVGVVYDAATGAGIDGVQITIPDTRVRVMSSGGGRFVITGVPTGEVVIQARRIGHETGTVKAAVTAKDTVTVRIPLTAIKTVLSEVVTTATGEQIRYEVANAVARLNVDSLVANTPVRSVTDLLASRIPGVEVMRSSGDPGAPARIRIRGVASVTGSNDPVVYIDGVRMSGPSSAQTNIYNRATSIPDVPVPSRLDDIDPQSIETIEVLRGPSASALYGTDAANGVIVIKTKRGSPQRTRWTFSLSHDFTKVPVNHPPLYTAYGRGHAVSAPMDCSLLDASIGFCTQDSVSAFNPRNLGATTNFGNGYDTRYSLGVSGGTSLVQYSITGSLSDAVGPTKIPNVDVTRLRILGFPTTDAMRRPVTSSRRSATMHLTMQPMPVLDMAFSGTSIRTKARNNTSAVQNLPADIDPVDTLNFTPMRYDKRITDNTVSRLIGSINATWRPLQWFTGSATVGLDEDTRNDNAVGELWSCTTIAKCVTQSSFTSRGRSSATSRGYTGSVTGTFSYRLTSYLNTQTSIGGQYRRLTSRGSSIQAFGLPPNTTSMNGAEQITVTPIDVREATAGWYLEENLNISEKLFLSAALRQDAGSALGQNIDAPIYPKFGISWVASNEPFFPYSTLLNHLRFRLSYGHAGVQPSPFDAPPTYQRVPGIVNGQTVSIIRYNTAGNSLLKPERSVEWEGGLDAELLNNRLMLDLTLYRGERRDAFIYRTLPTSVGTATTLQTQNLGGIRRSGLEMAVDARLIERGGWLWSARVSMSTNRDRVTSLGDASVRLDSTSRVVVGYPLTGRWQRPLLAYNDVNGDGVVSNSEVIFGDTLVYMGSTQPEYSMHYSTTISLPTGLSIVSDWSYQGAFTQIQERYDQRGLWDPTAPAWEQAYAQRYRAMGNWQTVSVLRWTSLNVNYVLPRRITAPLRADMTTLSFSVRNLGMWTSYRGSDPSINSSLTGDRLTDNGQTTPLTRNWSLALRLQF